MEGSNNNKIAKTYRPIEHDTLSINWSLLSRCNYRCSYCDQEHNNSKDLPPSKEVVFEFVNNFAQEAEKRGLQLVIEFSGGECTIAPYFDDLCQLLKKHNVKISIVTNGHRSISWWHENAFLFDKVIVSYHHEFANIDEYIEKVQFLSSQKHLQLHISYMLPFQFEKFQTSIQEYEKIKNLLKQIPSAQFSIQAMPLLTSISSANATYYSYSTEQWAFINTSHFSISGERAYCPRGLVVREYLDGSMDELYPSSAWNLPTFKGWLCFSGVEHFSIDTLGNIYRSWCTLPKVGHIRDKNLPWGLSAVICPHDRCINPCDMASTKKKLV